MNCVLFIFAKTFGSFLPAVRFFTRKKRIPFCRFHVQNTSTSEPCAVRKIRSVMFFGKFLRIFVRICVNDVTWRHILTETLDFISCHVFHFPFLSDILAQRKEFVNIGRQKISGFLPHEATPNFYFGTVYQSTREMIAISAASPRRGPILTILV